MLEDDQPVEPEHEVPRQDPCSKNTQQAGKNNRVDEQVKESLITDQRRTLSSRSGQELARVENIVIHPEHVDRDRDCPCDQAIHADVGRSEVASEHEKEQ